MKTDYLVGIDIGTTGVKILAVASSGIAAGRITVEYPLSTPRPGWAEQDPADWWKAIKEGLSHLVRKQGIKPESIAGIGLTGQMHGAVFLDGQCKVVHPAILWCDQRTAEECKEINDKAGRDNIFKITSNPVLTGFQAPKILWLRNNFPELYEKTRKVLLPKDYIRFLLTGIFATDVSDASGTSMLNVRERKWSAEILDKLGIDNSLLPECFESHEITGVVSAEAALETGLKKGTPVVAGAGDQAAAGVGSGAVEQGIVSLSYGTSGVVFGHSERVFTDSKQRLHTFCHAVKGSWHLMGVMLSAGGSLKWLKENVIGESFSEITEMAKKIPEGSEGLIFLPYLSGERCPYPDPYAKGVFFGLSLKHTREHISRATMEGITFGFKDILRIMESCGLSARKIRVTGGGAGNDFQCRLMADIFGKEIVRLSPEEGPSLGAAILAGTGIKMYPDVKQACREIVKETDSFSPDGSKTSRYEDFYGVYKNLYGKLQSEFDSISKIV